MITTIDRRHAERARIPCNIPVELLSSDDSDAFEADAVDLSVGGLSLRARRLPHVGSHLRCRFEAMPGGAKVSGRGEVVWTQPSGPHGGEFGLRFVEVEAADQALIDEMVAERIARIETPFTSDVPIVASLEIEHADAPIAARLIRKNDREALFEQQLDVLSLGKGVVAHAGVSLVRGSIAGVSLRMDGGLPTLSLTVRLAGSAPQFGEYDWSSDSDTDPDVFGHGDDGDRGDEERSGELAVLPPTAAASSLAAGVDTLLGVGSPVVALPPPIIARGPRDSEQLPLVFRRDSEPAPEPELSPESEEPLRLELRESDAPPQLVQDLDRVYIDQVSQADQADVELLAQEEGGDEAHEVSAEEWQNAVPEEAERSPLVRVLSVFAALASYGERAQDKLRRAYSQLRGRSLRTAGVTRTTGSQRPRRQTTSAQEHEPADERSTLRLLGIGLMTLAAVALFAYAFAPNHDDDVPLRPTAQGAPSEPAAAPSDGRPSELAAANAPSAPVSPPSAAASPRASSAINTTTLPPSSPYAVDIHAKAQTHAAPKPAAASSKPLELQRSFGWKQVPNARRFTLRMKEPIAGMQGSPDPHGFSVIIPGNRALDRAAPIAAGDPAVLHASIMNSRDHAKLTIRFRDGKSPAYRVSAQGSNLEVQLGL